MLPQIKRLLILFIIFIGVFIVVRLLLKPESYGDKGRYRANSLIDNESKSLGYAGKESCMECHEDKASSMETDLHDVLSCETCHGPSLQHVNLPDSIKPDKPQDRESCGICHSKNAAKMKNVIFQVDFNEHNTGKKCIDCHNPHTPWELKEQPTDENL